jgi:quinate/shikimate dehydrogenase
MQITAKEELICLLAYPARHSLSPLIHNTAFQEMDLPFIYAAFEVPPPSLRNAVLGLRGLGIKGASVSMPHKQSIIPYLDEISGTAELIGAVNTVYVAGGRLIGRNTDGLGHISALKGKGVEIKGSHLVVAGAGGAGKAIAAEAALSGAKKISIFNRKGANFSEAVALVSKLRGKSAAEFSVFDLADRDRFYEEIAAADIFTNATNVGMKPMEGESIAQESAAFHSALTVFDTVYNPPRTKLLAAAEDKGCVTVNGAEMLLYQGAEQFQIWTGRPFPLAAVKNVLNNFQAGQS